MISWFVVLHYKEALRTHATSETNPLQEYLLLEIKKLGVGVHPEFSYYQNEEKYLHMSINGSDHLKLKETLHLISLLPQPPLEIIVRRAWIDDDIAWIDDDIVVLLQKIDPKRLRFWSCSFDENLMTPYREDSKLEWLTISHCKFDSRFFDLINESHLERIRITHNVNDSPETEFDRQSSTAIVQEVSGAISGENPESEQVNDQATN